MSGSSILGHLPQLEQLKQDLETDNVANAYLFEGARRVGKFTVARGFAAELLTTGMDDVQRGETEDQLDRLLSPDLLILDQLWMEDRCEDFNEIAKTSNVNQEHRKKAGAKTDTISIGDVRAIQERLYDIPAGQYRCCLIRSVERMQDEAVNALLKILEEPPQGLVFILTTQSIPSLLPTLISRARILRFSRVQDTEMEPILSDVPEEEARFLLRLAQGAPGVIVGLKSDPEKLRAEHALYADAVSAWHSRTLLQCLQHLRPLQEKESAGRFLLHLSLSLRDEILTLPSEAGRALSQLIRGMDTNVNRQMLAQEFALAIRG